MPVITLDAACLAYGHRPLLDRADFQVEARERVGLIGRNGEGKSSLLRVLAGAIELDDGERRAETDLRIGWVAQEPELDPGSTIYDAVAAGLGADGELLAEYHRATAALAARSTTDSGAGDHADAAAPIPDDPARLARVDALHARLDASDAWTLSHRVDTVLDRLGLAPDACIGTLSGGWKKRVALARALAASPGLLLLDEPTNHLDVAAIEWLEALLLDFPGAVVCVTHDRRFLDRIATRIVELDRGRLRSYPGSFVAYQAQKAADLADEAASNARFDKLLAEEEIWIRKGIEARRTRNEGRVRRLEQLRVERAARRERLGRVDLRVDVGARSGQMVAELTDVVKAFGARPIVRGFTTRILRGDRIGLIGPNGIGKTTLLKLITGELEPDAGTVRRGVNLTVAYFDQFREHLDPEASLQDTISPGAEWVEIGRERRHVISYLGDFLFAPERARSPVRSLSGGERNRLLLARLFARPANVLVLDEPTNDLDIDTLELLEALLQDYHGTIFLVSHDRAFLDNVVTQVIAFEGDGVLREYAGGYSDWAARRTAGTGEGNGTGSGNGTNADGTGAGVGAGHRTGRDKGNRPAASRSPVEAASPPRPKRLTPPEQRELAGLPARIEELEAAVAAVRERLADPATYRAAADDVKAVHAELAAREAELAAAYARWEDLEARAAATAGAAR